MPKPNGHGYRAIAKKWASGNLQTLDTNGNIIYTEDAANRKVTFPASAALDVSAGTLTLAAGQIANAALATIAASKLADPTVNNALAPGFKVAHFHYDATVQSGLQGTVPIAGATLVPSNALVPFALMRVTTAPVGVGASIALQLEGANDIISVAAISGAPWSTTGIKACVPVMSAATTKLTTAARDLSAVITAADLSAAIFDVFVFYIVIL